MKAFCLYFKLDEDFVTQYFEQKNPDELTPYDLISDLNIALKSSQSNGLEIVCRHMITASDAYGDSYKRIGALDLKRML